MRIYQILGKKTSLLDKSQAILMGLFLLPGAIIESLFFLLICPTTIFVATFIIKERFFGGKPEWAIFSIRMISGKKTYYTRQIKDKVASI